MIWQRVVEAPPTSSRSPRRQPQSGLLVEDVDLGAHRFGQMQHHRRIGADVVGEPVVEDELHERAVRMVLDHGHEYGSQWEAMCSVAEKLGPKAETVRLWVRQAEKDTGRRPGATTDELAELKRLKRENAELRRANDILKAAAHFFGAELDRQSKK